MSRALKRTLRRIKRRCRRLRRKLKNPRLYPIYALIFFILVESALFPEKTKEFLWRYYWAPIVADAKGGFYQGISEGYNPISTATYAIFFIIALYLIYLAFKRYKVSLTFNLILAFIPLIISGSMARVLEDMGIISEPVSYLFISPLIYIWFGALGLFILFYSEFLERREKYEAMILSIIPYPVMVRFFWFFMSSISAPEDLIFFVSLILLYSIMHFFMVRRLEFERNSSVFLYSMFFLTFIGYYFFSGVQIKGMKHPMEILIIISLSLLISLSMIPISKAHEHLRVLGEKSNVLMMFSQSLDGIATWRSLYFSYSEKHVIPTAILQSPLGPAVFPALKILVVFLIIYALDIRYRKRLDDDAAYLVKFAVIILGLGPGLRDMLRISLGV